MSLPFSLNIWKYDFVWDEIFSNQFLNTFPAGCTDQEFLYVKSDVLLDEDLNWAPVFSLQLSQFREIKMARILRKLRPKTRLFLWTRTIIVRSYYLITPQNPPNCVNICTFYQTFVFPDEHEVLWKSARRCRGVIK